MKDVLIIFARNPEKGRVKSRIAKDSSEDFALACYHELLSYTLNLAGKVSCKQMLFFSDHLPDSSEYPQHELYQQRGENLGDRMRDAIRLAILKGAQKIIIIGSDCEEISVETLHLAFERLDEHEVVIGPAIDGGYYLLGLKKLHHLLLEDKPWSQNSLLSETINDLEELKLNYSLLDPKRDVDYLRDISPELMRRINDQRDHTHLE